jgi:hypothetical protein
MLFFDLALYTFHININTSAVLFYHRVTHTLSRTKVILPGIIRPVTAPVPEDKQPTSGILAPVFSPKTAFG